MNAFRIGDRVRIADDYTPNNTSLERYNGLRGRFATAVVSYDFAGAPRIAIDGLENPDTPNVGGTFALWDDRLVLA